MSLVSNKRASLLVQNVVQQGSKLELSALKDYKDWEESMRLLMTQAGVLPAILFSSVEQLLEALINYHDDEDTGDGALTLAQIRNKRRQASYNVELPTMQRTALGVKQEESKHEEESQEISSPKKEISSEKGKEISSKAEQDRPSLTKEQQRSIAILEFSSATTQRQVERYFELASSTVVCALQAAVNKDLHHLLENVNDRDSAYQVWHALKDATRSDIVSQLNTEGRRLFELRMDPGTDPAKFMSTFRSQLKHVNANGGDVTFRFAAALFLGALPPEEYTFELSKLRDRLANQDVSTDWTHIRKTLLARYTDQQSKAEADGGFAMYTSVNDTNHMENRLAIPH